MNNIIDAIDIIRGLGYGTNYHTTSQVANGALSGNKRDGLSGTQERQQHSMVVELTAERVKQKKEEGKTNANIEN